MDTKILYKSLGFSLEQVNTWLEKNKEQLPRLKKGYKWEFDDFVSVKKFNTENDETICSYMWTKVIDYQTKKPDMYLFQRIVDNLDFHNYFELKGENNGK